MIVKNWDLSYLCEGKEEWQKLGTVLSKKIEFLKNVLTKINSAYDIKTAIDAKIEMDQFIERVYCYPKRLLDLNSHDREAKAMFDEALFYYGETEKVSVLLKKVFLEKAELVDDFLSEFPYFKRYIELIRQMDSHQVKNEDTYVALKRELEVLQSIYRALVREDMIFRDPETGKTVSEAELSNLSHSQNVKNRKYAFQITMCAYQSVSNTLATIYQNKINVEEEIAKMRGFKTHLESRLYEDGLPNSIVSNLITTVKGQLELEHEFMQYKKDILGLQELHLYDMGQTIFSSHIKKYSLEDALDILKQCFGILGEDYVKCLEEGFYNGWLDLEPTKTKRKDSFSAITYSGVPYTMLHYKENLESLRVLAHETGHMIHTSYAKENKFEYFEYSLFLAEIASKVHEILLYHYLIEKSVSEEETYYLIEQLLSTFCTSLFSQTMLTEFELEVHQKLYKQEPIQAEVLSSLYLSLASAYYGKAFTSDELIGINFAKIPHFYLYPSYYVWQYSIGISIAYKIAADLIHNKNNMRKKYLKFLKAGNQISVTESLNLVGIDLEKGTYIEEACEFMKEKLKVLKR